MALVWAAISSFEAKVQDKRRDARHNAEAEVSSEVENNSEHCEGAGVIPGLYHCELLLLQSILFSPGLHVLEEIGRLVWHIIHEAVVAC